MQDLVDGLAHMLGRSVAVDDSDLRLIVHSTHFGDVDAARLRSLTDRDVDADVREYLLEQGIRTLGQSKLIAPQLRLGVNHPRRCFPLRYLHELFGFMWVTEDTPLDADALEQAETVSTRLAAILAREARMHDARDEELEALVGTLLESNDPRSAAADLIRTGALTAATFFDVYAVRVDTAHAAPDNILTSEIFRKAFSRVGLNRPPHSWVYATRVSHPALILGYWGEPSAEQRRAVATQLVREIERSEDTTRGKFNTVGVGSIVSGLSEAAGAYRQAQSGARIAASLRQRVGIWSEHPLEALLDAVIKENYSPGLIPHVLDHLDLAAHADLVRFLRLYVDSAGNVAHVSERLGVHRTTIYYRLQRFKKDTGIDLDRGTDRFLVQLWLYVLDHRPQPGSL